MKNIFPKFILLILLMNINIVIASDIAKQNINTYLGEVLTIDSIYYEGEKCPKNGELQKISIKKIEKNPNNYNVLHLSPIKVKIHTNLNKPIYIKAQFTKLNHTSKNCGFNSSDLSFFPDTHTINQPYDMCESCYFTPIAKCNKLMEKGSYKGNIIFTLGVL